MMYKQKKSVIIVWGVVLLSISLAVVDRTSDAIILRALWPALVALVVTVYTRQAILGLLLGAFSGVLFLSGGNVFSSLKVMVEEHFFPALSGSWHVGAILFTLILGKRRLEMTTVGLGLLCFFDGLANSLLLGRIAKPLADRVGVSRAKLAYIVDSTGSSVACVAFISTWIATQLSLIQQSVQPYAQVTDSAYVLFFKSVPYNFYCLFTLIFLVIVIVRRWDIGPMKRVESKVQKKIESVSGESGGVGVRVALIPILVLSLAIVVLFYTWETEALWPVTSEKLSTAFSGSAGPYALTFGALMGLCAACLVFPRQRRAELPSVVKRGVSSMLQPVLLLIMAWMFGSVISELGTGQWVASAMGEYVTANYIPAAVFLTGAVISFTTGSSWGTMALLMPIALPAYLDISGGDVSLLPATIAAVFSGAVFGDHCSPFSDTTIVSAFACGVSPEEHVLTQLPYALISAGVAFIFGFIMIAMVFE